MVGVGGVGPEFVVAGEEELGAGEGEQAQAAFQVVALGGGGVADEQEEVEGEGVDLADELGRQRAGAGMVIVEIRGGKKLHGSAFDSGRKNRRRQAKIWR
jgi:hypothetical protein